MPSGSNAISCAQCRPTATSRGFGSMTSERCGATCTMTSGAGRGRRKGVHYSVTPGDGAPAKTSTDPDDDDRCSNINRGEPAAIGVERYRPLYMVARRLRCSAPSGREFPIVVIGDFVIAPETVCSEPGLGWLELERFPRL